MSITSGVKVFSATKARDRDELGEVMTHWLKSNPGLVVTSTVVTQSSDSEYHCLTLTFFYRGELASAPATPGAT